MPATKSKIRGVAMQGWQVRNLLLGTMCQFRIPLKKPPEQFAGGVHPGNAKKHDAPYIDAYCGEPKTADNPRGMGRNWYWWTGDDRMGPFVGRSPYQPGEVLFIRETWEPAKNGIRYRADGHEEALSGWWRPPQHMREADSRKLRIKITSVELWWLQELDGCSENESDWMFGFDMTD